MTTVRPQQENPSEETKSSNEKITKRCSTCGEAIDTHNNERCLWCHIVHRLKDNSNNTGEHKCRNADNGCPYRHDDVLVVSKHRMYCKYNIGKCPKCRKDFFGISIVDHLKEHSTKMEALINGDTAKVQITHKILINNTSPYHTVIVRGLEFFIEFNQSWSELVTPVITNTELPAYQYFDITCRLTSDNTSDGETVQLYKNLKSSADWKHTFQLRDFNKNNSSVLNMEFIIKIKN